MPGNATVWTCFRSNPSSVVIVREAVLLPLTCSNHSTLVPSPPSLLCPEASSGNSLRPRERQKRPEWLEPAKAGYGIDREEQVGYAPKEGL